MQRGYCHGLLGDAVEVEGHSGTQPRAQVVDRRGVADRIGFEREAASRSNPMSA